MTDVAPFRESPKFLLCPRCGEMLERAFEAVRTCLRCEGVWIATVMLERAFGDPRWPRGPSMWWRNALECPECAAEGAVQVMAAVQAGEAVVDRCASHGLWLDRFELVRLLGTSDAVASGAGVSPDLAALRARLAVPDVDLEGLARRRDAWRQDAGKRRKAAEEYRSWLEAESRLRLDREAMEAARAARQQREREVSAQAERADAAFAAAEREKRAAAARKQEAARSERTLAIQRLGDVRQQISAEVARLEAQLAPLRDQLRDAEAVFERSRAKLRALDEELEALRAQPV